MADKAWKADERKLARFFGAVRNALSGRNSKVSASDTKHESLFIECKRRKRHALWSLWSDTKVLARKEEKTAVVTLKEVGRHGHLLVVNIDDLDEVIDERLIADDPEYREDMTDDERKKWRSDRFRKVMAARAWLHGSTDAPNAYEDALAIQRMVDNPDLFWKAQRMIQEREGELIAEET